MVYNFFVKNYINFCDRIRYYRGMLILEKQMKQWENTNFPITSKMMILKDQHASAGRFDGHYFLQDIYMAKKVGQNLPKDHYDIGSRVDGFIAHLISMGISVTMIDIRPLPVVVEGLNFICHDATNLEGINDNSISSLSCLHAVEHFGLGRYGDPIDAFACFKAMSAIQRVMASNGILYFSVPIGMKNEIVYNAHRIFSPQTILEYFDQMKLIEFSYIHNYEIYTYSGDEIIEKLMKNEINISRYDCGMFVFIKK